MKRVELITTALSLPKSSFSSPSLSLHFFSTNICLNFGDVKYREKKTSLIIPLQFIRQTKMETFCDNIMTVPQMHEILQRDTFC